MKAEEILVVSSRSVQVNEDSGITKVSLRVFDSERNANVSTYESIVWACTQAE